MSEAFHWDSLPWSQSSECHALPHRSIHSTISCYAANGRQDTVGIKRYNTQSNHLAKPQWLGLREDGRNIPHTTKWPPPDQSVDARQALCIHAADCTRWVYHLQPQRKWKFIRPDYIFPVTLSPSQPQIYFHGSQEWNPLWSSAGATDPP